MLFFKRFSPLIPSLKPISFYALSSHGISQKLKLLEVPDICTSEEWTTIIQESRTTLQNYSKYRRYLNVENIANHVSVPLVVQRLHRASHSNNHLINTFKYLLENSDETSSLLRWPGLITLMLSQGIGNPFIADNFISKSLEDVIWSSQVILAEIINTFHCSLVFRKENWRVSSSKKKRCHLKAMDEVDRLMNGYFTSSSIYKLSSLKNDKVIFLLSDVMESLSQTRSYSSSINQINNRYLWEHETFQTRGILLATGCQATLELAGHDERSQQKAFEFGHFFTLAIKANADIQQFWNYQLTKTASLNLSSFPVALHLENNPETLEYIFSCGPEMDNLDVDQLNNRIVSSSSINDAKQLLADYISRTLSTLQDFKDCKNGEMIEYLTKLVKTLNYINEK